MKTAFLLLLTLIQAILAESSEGKRLTLAGSSTIQPIMEEAAQAFEGLHPDVRMDVQGGGSSVGLTSTIQGMADIGMVSRDLSKEEKSRLVATPIALDGLAVIVHASNPLRNINHQEVIDVYTGKTTRWNSLGGPDAPITVINKEEGRATLEMFEKHFDLKGKFTRDAVIIGPNGQAIATVAGNPRSIAYVSIGSAAVAEAEGTPIRRLALDGVEASVANVKNGTYGLRRVLNLVTKGPPLGLTRLFLIFVQGKEGSKIIESLDFVPWVSSTP